MRTYIKEHPTEFGRKEGEVDQEALVAVKPTEASQYAAATRQRRQDQEYSNLQWSYDSVLAGIKAIYSGLKALFETLLDMSGESVSREKAAMLLLILVLAVSNLYTYYSRPVHQKQEVADTIRALIESAALSKPTKYAADEVGDISRILDQLETRIRRMRSELPA